MGLETGTYISDLNESWPVGDTDPKAQGDDHLRLIKKTLKNTFPGLNQPFSMNLGSPATGDILYFDGTGWRNLPIGTSGQFLSANGLGLPQWVTGANTLAGLTDVNIAVPTAGQALIYNGANWANTSTFGTLSGLTDTTIGTLAEGDFMRYTGSTWANTQFVEADVVEIEVRNDTGAALNEGDVVYQTGYSTPGKAITVSLADASDPSKMPAIGIVKNGGISNGSNGFVIVYGTATSLNTNGLTQNQALYVDTTPGQYTTTRPTDPDHAVQKIGVVGRVNNSNGTITVVGAGRTNDVPNEIANPMFVTESAYIGSQADENLRLSATSGPTVRLHGGSSGSPAGGLEFVVNGITYYWPTALGGSPAAGLVLAYNTDGQMYWTAAGGGGGIANVVEDVTPQLGGNLDVNDKIILNSGSQPVRIWDTGSDLSVRNQSIALEANAAAGPLTIGAGSIVLSADASATGGIYLTSSVSAPTTGQIANGDILIEGASDASVSVTTSGSGTFVWNSATVATQTWVTSQGYLTAGSPQGTFVQAGDAISRLTNDAGYITAGSPQGIFVVAGDAVSRLTNDAGYITTAGSPASKLEIYPTVQTVGSPGAAYTLTLGDESNKKTIFDGGTITVKGGVFSNGSIVDVWCDSATTIVAGSPTVTLNFATGAGSPNATIAKGWITFFFNNGTVYVQ